MFLVCPCLAWLQPGPEGGGDPAGRGTPHRGPMASAHGTERATGTRTSILHGDEHLWLNQLVHVRRLRFWYICNLRCFTVDA